MKAEFKILTGPKDTSSKVKPHFYKMKCKDSMIKYVENLKKSKIIKNKSENFNTQ